MLNENNNEKRNSPLEIPNYSVEERRRSAHDWNIKDEIPDSEDESDLDED